MRRGMVWITLAVLVVTIAALTSQLFRTLDVLDVQSRHLVHAEVSAVMDRYRGGGRDALLKAIEDKRRRPESRDTIYALTDADGRMIAGNLDRWPFGAEQPGWHVFEIPEQRGSGAVKRRIEAEVLLLEPGEKILIGHPADGRNQLRARYLETLAWSAAAATLIGLVLGWWTSRRARRFVAHAAATGERFLAGHLEERLPVTGRGDEFDRLAEMVNACFAEVERVVASLRAATDGLAHDLKTPLTRMKTRAELAVLRNAPSDPEFLAATTRDIDGLLKLINDLLALARVEALSLDTMQPIDLADIAREAIELYDPLIEGSKHQLADELAPVWVKGVRALLVQACCNLIDNALKHGAGTITVRTLALGSDAELSVADQGPGIGEEDITRVAERLVRLDRSRSSEGSGLGLSIVAAVARAHRGALVLSDNAPGLVARMRLPMASVQGVPNKARA